MAEKKSNLYFDYLIFSICGLTIKHFTGKLSERHGFSRCAGRLFAANLITPNLDLFHQLIESYIPPNSRVSLILLAIYSNPSLQALLYLKDLY